MLGASYACLDARKKFLHEWPEGCEVNFRNARRAQALDLDIHWLALQHLLGNEHRNYFERIGKYEDVAACIDQKLLEWGEDIGKKWVYNFFCVLMDFNWWVVEVVDVFTFLKEWKKIEKRIAHG